MRRTRVVTLMFELLLSWPLRCWGLFVIVVQRVRQSEFGKIVIRGSIVKGGKKERAKGGEKEGEKKREWLGEREGEKERGKWPRGRYQRPWRR